MSKGWIALGLITLVLFVGTAVLYVLKPQEEPAETDVIVSPEFQQLSSLPLTAPMTPTRKITLFLGDVAQGRLVQKAVTIAKGHDLAQDVTQAVQYLLHPDPDQPDVRNAAFPDGAELLNVFVTSAGVAYVNWNRNLQDRHLGGLSAELATLTAVVNTILTSFPEIKQVQILVEGAEIETLAGHIDCRKPFLKTL